MECGGANANLHYPLNRLKEQVIFKGHIELIVFIPSSCMTLRLRDKLVISAVAVALTSLSEYDIVPITMNLPLAPMIGIIVRKVVQN